MITKKNYNPLSGFVMIFFAVVLIAAIAHGVYLHMPGIIIPSAITMMLILRGFMIVNPNDAMALILFGNYVGRVKKSGFFEVNPFIMKKEILLRARNLNGQMLKVNDKIGNPIEIAAVIVWKVSDTAKALYAVNDFDVYVSIQSEEEVRHLAGVCPYDNFEDNDATLTLRGATDQIHKMLVDELNERLSKAGIDVLEVRISHLAYAPEIAGAMLQRQQAAAVVEARQVIAEGTVGMVEMAVLRLSKKQIVTLDEERKAAMVSNLLVVVFGDKNVSPVINAGTLYN